MRIAVSGSRSITDSRAVDRIMAQYFSVKDELLHGGAKGVDTLAADWAFRYFCDIEAFPADWDTHGRAAGPIRNRQMLESDADMLVAIWDGKSRGTKNAIDTALSLGIETHVHFVRAVK